MNEAINNRHKWQKANDVGFIQKCLYLGILFSAITQTFLANFDEILQGTWRDYYVNVTIGHPKSSVWYLLTSSIFWSYVARKWAWPPCVHQWAWGFLLLFWSLTSWSTSPFLPISAWCVSHRRAFLPYYCTSF